MSGDKHVLAAGAAVIIAAGSGSYVFAQTGPAAGIPGNPVTTPPGSAPTTAPGAERTGLSLPTEAQSSFGRDRNVAVSQRPHEGYEAKGIRAGAFLVYPKITAAAEYDDNIYATTTNKQDDTIWRITPEVNVSSDWSRHGVGAYARAVLNRYQDRKSENTTDYGVGVNGRLDIRRFTSANASLNWARLTEPRSSPSSPGTAAKPVRYDLTSFDLSGQHEINRLRFTGRYGFQDFDYRSPPKVGGGIVDQNFRDREVHNVVGRIDYAISPSTAWFVEIDGNKRHYKSAPPTGDVSRNSSGMEGLVGVNFELSALVRGEVAAGYLHQNFKDARLKDLDSFGARGRVEWFPTQLTTVTLDLSRTVEDSAVPNSGAFLSTGGNLRVDHELLRNVILNANAGYNVDRYKDVNRTDHHTSAGVGGTYLLNRVFGVSGNYSYEKRKIVRGSGTSFTENTVSVAVTAQF